jgi:transposase
MTLDDTQRKKVAGWIAEGLKLSEIQNRLASELGVRMTYMDVRLLVDDLKLTPKDIEPPKPIAPMAPAPPAPQTSPTGLKVDNAPAPESSVSGVSVSVDHLARPGTVVSGKVTFTDGKKADWYIDQTGRLGLAPQEAGYRPPAADVQQFQILLEAELSKLGL